MFVRFSNDNIWEIRHSDETVTAFYRKGLILKDEEVKDVHHPEREYRLWKAYFNNQDDHLPDAFPLIFMAKSEGFDMIKRIHDTKYIFNRLR